MQNQDGCDRVIAYNSMSFDNAQRKYSTVEKELAGLRWAVKGFKPFLYGVDFIIRTDHQPLMYLHHMRLVDNRLARTLTDLSQYSFTVEYVPGPTNVAADTLSRFVLHPNASEEEQPGGAELVEQELEGGPVPGGGDSLFLFVFIVG